VKQPKRSKIREEEEYKRPYAYIGAVTLRTMRDNPENRLKRKPLCQGLKCHQCCRQENCRQLWCSLVFREEGLRNILYKYAVTVGLLSLFSRWIRPGN